MTVEEFYSEIGGDYEDVKLRLQTQERIEKFVKRFPQDPNFEELCRALEAKDYETAFRAAHTLKGVSATLSFTQLFKADNVLTEELRAGKTEGLEGLMAEVKMRYEETVLAISGLD